jgi:hypothetical protein
MERWDPSTGRLYPRACPSGTGAGTIAAMGGGASRRGLVLLGAAAIAGCRSAPVEPIAPVTATLRFENVRSMPGLDEWEQIRPRLERYDTDMRLDWVQASGQRKVGDVEIATYEAGITLATAEHLERLNAAIAGLAQRRYGRGERIEYRLADARADLTYATTFVTASLEMVLRGETDPMSIVTVYLHDGTRVLPPVDARGKWSIPVTLAPGRRYIYGFSEDRRAPGAPTRKHFRISVHTLVAEPLSPGEFETLRARRP